MAFRRLTLGERFALRGATTYRTLLVDPATVGDPKRCTWGFVPQSQLIGAMIREQQKYQFRVCLDKRGVFSQAEGISKDFERHKIDFQEFKVRMGSTPYIACHKRRFSLKDCWPCPVKPCWIHSNLSLVASLKGLDN